MEGSSWQRWLFNRVTISLAVIVLAIVGWNAYRVRHDDGILTGYVVGPAGQPVDGAEVTLWERAVATISPQDKVITGPEGRFRFENHHQYSVILSAEKPGVGKSARVQYDLYFRGENRKLDEPLQIEAP